MNVCLLLCLILLGSGVSCLVRDASETDIEEDEIIKLELDVSIGGRHVHETSMSDRDCHAQWTTATFDDNTTNTVINDLDVESSLVVFSASPDVCYVRTLSGKKRVCKGGYEIIKKKEAPRTEVTLYKLGPELNISLLPQEFKDVCENRTVYQLLEDTRSTDSNDLQQIETTVSDVGPLGLRRRRQVRRKVCESRRQVECTKTSHCHYCCTGWWFWTHCATKCCSTDTVCQHVDTPFCRWEEN